MRSIRYQKGRKGHTLAEVLIVVAIIAILVSIAVVSYFAYIRSMTKLEYDNYAKEIFVAAQNHLSMSESQGYLGRTDFGTEEPKIAGIDDTGVGVYFFVVKTDYSPVLSDESVLNLMLPFGAVDETVRLGGSYIVRYHKDSAKVLDVFYWRESGTRFDHSYADEDYADFLSKRGDKKALRYYEKDKSVIGWYGGADAASLTYGETLRTPEIIVTNADRLTVTVKDLNVNTDSAKCVQNARLKLLITGLTSKNSREITLSATGVSDFYGPTDISSDSDGWVTYNIVLDDITAPGKHFSEQFCTGDRPLIPGEDVTIQAVAFNNDELTNIAYSSAQTTNSLFAYNPAGDTAHIASFRHLENLEESVSALAYTDTRLGCVTKTSGDYCISALQTTDLSWGSFPGEYIYASVGPGVSLKLTQTEHTFHPVSPDYVLTYDGAKHTIANAAIDTTAYAESAEKDAGLFGKLSGGSVSDLRLLDFSVAGANAGALAGSANEGAVITNVLAVNSAGGVSPTITGSASVGGLIGSANGVTVRKSAAALVVSSTGADAGGLIGKATGSTEVTACYSGGHTTDGKYTSDFNVTAAQSAGGLIGDAADADISFSYSTCSAKGATAGGFVGKADGGSLDTCYATGLVQATAAGAFAGTLGTGTVSDCGYYGIVNESEKTGGYEYMSALSTGAHDGVGAFDSSAAVFNDFIGAAREGASPYDAKLVRYYQGKYGLLTVGQLGASVTSSDLVSVHYGDWPSPETWIINIRDPQSASGGSGSGPVLHGTSNLSEEKIERGAVIQDQTGTCVIMSGMQNIKTAYSNGATVAEIVAQFGDFAKSVDPTDVKDSTFTGELKTGDLYYDSASGTYYYVTIVSLFESRPNTAWIPLIP